MTRMQHKKEESQYNMNIGGSIMRQKEEDLPSDNGTNESSSFSV
jgi:hypothetical protein